MKAFIKYRACVLVICLVSTTFLSQNFTNAQTIPAPKVYEHCNCCEWLEVEGELPVEPTREKQLLRNVKTLRAILERQQGLISFQISSVASCLADDYLELGVELKEQYAKTNYVQLDLNLKANEYFTESVKYSLKSLENRGAYEKYSFMRKIIDNILRTGDLYLALEYSNKFENLGIEPGKFEDHYFLKVKGDVLFFMGKRREAALVYEKWIDKGNVSNYLHPDSSLLSQLIELKHSYGHPANILETSKDEEVKKPSRHPNRRPTH